MKFIVNFTKWVDIKGQYVKPPIIHMPPTKLGLKHLDVIEKIFPQTPLKYIDGDIKLCVLTDFRLEIPPTLAKSFKGFYHSAEILVRCKNLLNEFVAIRYKQKEKTIVAASYVIDEDELLEAWKKAGHPLIWNNK